MRLVYERREEQRTDDDEPPADSASDPDEIGFQYLAKLSASLADIALEYDRDRLDDRDVRVRADGLPDRLR